MSTRSDYLERDLLETLDRARIDFTRDGHTGMAKSMLRAMEHVRALAQFARGEESPDPRLGVSSGAETGK